MYMSNRKKIQILEIIPYNTISLKLVSSPTLAWLISKQIIYKS